MRDVVTKLTLSLDLMASLPYLKNEARSKRKKGRCHEHRSSGIRPQSRRSPDRFAHTGIEGKALDARFLEDVKGSEFVRSGGNEDAVENPSR